MDAADKGLVIFAFGAFVGLFVGLLTVGTSIDDAYTMTRFRGAEVVGTDEDPYSVSIRTEAGNIVTIEVPTVDDRKAVAEYLIAEVGVTHDASTEVH